MLSFSESPRGCPYPKFHGTVKYEDNLKYEDSLKYEDDLEYEETLKYKWHPRLVQGICNILVM